jgi:hypothetical protein
MLTKVTLSLYLGCFLFCVEEAHVLFSLIRCISFCKTRS